MAMTRNKTHFIVMTVLYNEINDFVNGKGTIRRDATEMISSLCEQPFESCDPYIFKCVSAAMLHYGDIIKAFEPKLKNWKWERIPMLIQSILLMSYAHYTYVEKVSKNIVIDIAVTLAKTYAEEKQAKFVNAILDEVLN